jgi:hypothetical protein
MQNNAKIIQNKSKLCKISKVMQNNSKLCKIIKFMQRIQNYVK